MSGHRLVHAVVAAALGAMISLTGIGVASAGVGAAAPDGMSHTNAVFQLVVDLRTTIGHREETIDSMFIAYEDDGGRLYIGLGALTAALKLPLVVDAMQGRAGDAILAGQPMFSVDLSRGNLRTGTQTRSLAPGDAVIAENDIALAADILETVTPFSFAFDIRRMRLVVESTVTLPIEHDRARRARWLTHGGPAPQTERIEGAENRYTAFTPPAADIRVGSRYDSGSNAGFRNAFSLTAAGDLAYHSANIRVWGSDEDGISAARMTISRHDPYGQLLGPLRATAYEIGDLRSDPLPHVTRIRDISGVRITNRPFDTARMYSAHEIIGDTEPGWSVELYRGTQLLDFTDATEAGTYVFASVPINHGVNLFRIVQLGPEGQVIETARTINIGTGMIPPGDLQYDMTAGTTGTLLPALQTNSAENSHDGTHPYFFARAAYGATDRFTLTGAAAFLRSDRARGLGDQAYGRIGALAAMGPVFGRADVTVDQDGGLLYTAQAQSRLPFWNSAVQVEAAIFDGLTGEANQSTPVDWTVKAGMVTRPHRLVGLRFDYERWRTASGDEQDRFDASVLGAHRGLSWALRAGQDDLGITDRRPSRITGIASVRYNGLPVRPSLDLSYGIGEHGFELERAGLGLNWTHGDVRARLAVTHDLIGADITTASLGLTRDFGPVSAGLSVGGDSTGAVKGGITLSVGAVYDPHRQRYQPVRYGITQQGGASVRVVRDVGGGQFDAVPDVTVRAGAGSGRSQTNAAGVALIDRQTTGRPAAVTVEGGPLSDDHFWAAIDNGQGNAFVPRPGYLHPIEITIVATGEVDGTVRRRLQGDVEPAAGITMQLIDQDGAVAQETHAAHDGFYLFFDVIPGQYSLRPDPDQIEGLGYAAARPIVVVITRQGNFVFGQDFVLEPATLEDIPTEGGRAEFMQ